MRLQKQSQTRYNYFAYSKLFWIKEESSGRSQKRFLIFFYLWAPLRLKIHCHLRYITKRCSSAKLPSDLWSWSMPGTEPGHTLWPMKSVGFILFSLQSQCQPLPSPASVQISSFPLAPWIPTFEPWNLKGLRWMESLSRTLYLTVLVICWIS